MSRKVSLIALAVMAAHSAAAAAASEADRQIFSFNGFATLGVVHSDQNDADYVGSVFQPDGAGYSRSWDIGPDTKVASQVHAAFTDKLSATLQVVAQHAYDDTYTPQIEWANIKYAITNDLDVRVGRVVLPAFMLSESRFVGYAGAAIRPPQEVYINGSITSNDGLDLTYRSRLGRATNAVQGFYGSSTVKVPGGGEVKSKPNWGVNDTLSVGDATLRVGYTSMTLDINITQLDPLFDGLRDLGSALNAFGFQSSGAQALALVEKYKLSDMAWETYSLGASYDPGQWFVMTEGAIGEYSGFLADSKGWYVTGGYRIAKFTPYATFAQLKSEVAREAGISTAGLPAQLAGGAAALNAGVNATLASFSASQRTASIGMRWDFMSSAALKVQYDRVTPTNGSDGRFTNVQPGFQSGDSANLISVAVDFVF